MDRLEALRSASPTLMSRPRSSRRAGPPPPPPSAAASPAPPPRQPFENARPRNSRTDEIDQQPDDQDLQQHAEHRCRQSAFGARRVAAVPEQPGAEEPAGEPGQERMALKKAAAAIGRSRRRRGEARLARRLGARGDAAAQRLRAVVLEGARSAAAHARRAAARGAAGAGLGDRRGQRQGRAKEQRQQDAPVQQQPSRHGLYRSIA